MTYCKGAIYTSLSNMSSRLGINMALYSRKYLIWMFNNKVIMDKVIMAFTHQSKNIFHWVSSQRKRRTEILMMSILLSPTDWSKALQQHSEIISCSCVHPPLQKQYPLFLLISTWSVLLSVRAHASITPLVLLHGRWQTVFIWLVLQEWMFIPPIKN